MKTSFKTTHNYVEMQIKEAGKNIAFVSCTYHESKNEVEIRDIEIEKGYRNEEVRKYILLKILEYSTYVDAKRIIYYCHGIGNGLTIDAELKWCLENGFILDHVVYDITPCVSLKLK